MERFSRITSVTVASIFLAALSCAAPLWAQSVPALRVTAPNGATSVMMGAIHIAVEGLLEPNDEILLDAKVLVLEKDPKDPWTGLTRPLALSSLSAVTEGKQMPPAPWARALAPSQIDEITKRVSCNMRTPLEGARILTAHFLAQESAVTIQEVSVRPCGGPQQLSREQYLSGVAEVRGIDLQPLETQAGTEPLRLSIPNQTYLQHIAAALGPRAAPAIKQVANALNAGDYDLVASALDSLTDDAPAKAQYHATMVIGRNMAWLPKLVSFLDAGQAVIVVGAQHLPGRNGLIQLLKERGYRFETTHLPAR